MTNNADGEQPEQPPVPQPISPESAESAPFVIPPVPPLPTVSAESPAEPAAPVNPSAAQQDAWMPAHSDAAGEPLAARPRKKRALWHWISAAVVVLLLVIGGVVGISLGNAAHAPALQVAAYLDALKAGKAEAALKLVGTKVAATDLLLSDEAYGAASDRIKRYTIGETVTAGNTATVTARITQGSESYEQEFMLAKTGKEMLFFDAWTLQAPELGTVAADVSAPADATVTIAGADIAEADSIRGRYEFRALPGSYPIVLDGKSAWYSAEEQTATVIGFGSRAAEIPTLSVTLTEDGQAAAAAAVEAHLDACIASTELVPQGCPFFGVNIRGYELTNIHWTVRKPVFTVSTEFIGAGWGVTTETLGAASAAADARDPSSGASGTVRTIEMPVSIGGNVTGFTDEGAVYVP